MIDSSAQPVLGQMGPWAETWYSGSAAWSLQHRLAANDVVYLCLCQWFMVHGLWLVFLYLSSVVLIEI